MYRYLPSSATAGSFSLWPTMALESIPGLENRFLGCSNGCIPTMSIQVAESGWQYVNESWSSTAGGFGWSGPSLAEDQSSRSPFPPDPSSDASPDSDVSSRPARLTVWLIEDSATDVFVIKDVLRSCAFEFDLRVMSDGDSALSLLRSVEDNERSEPPGLILLDLNVPKVHGLEVLSALRKTRRCSKAPVVIVTSSDSPSDLKAIQELGAKAYFRKPHDLDEFMKLADIIKWC